MCSRVTYVVLLDVQFMIQLERLIKHLTCSLKSAFILTGSHEEMRELYLTMRFHLLCVNCWLTLNRVSQRLWTTVSVCYGKLWPNSLRVGLVIQSLWWVRVSAGRNCRWGEWMSSALSTLNTTTEVLLSKTPNPQLLPGTAAFCSVTVFSRQMALFLFMCIWSLLLNLWWNK